MQTPRPNDAARRPMTPSIRIVRRLRRAARRTVRPALVWAVVAAYGLTNVGGAYAAEKSFWSARRETASRRSPAGGMRVASLTAGADVLRQMPAARPVAFQSALRGAESRLTGGDVAGRPSVWLTGAVLPYGTVREIHTARNPKAPLVVHIQDAHEIEDAQRNIAAMIDGLRTARGVSLVGLEGARGAFDFNPFRRSSRADVNRAAADVLLGANYIGGAEFAALTAQREPTLWGLEDAALYRANVQALTASESSRDEARRRLAALERAADALKEKIYGPAMKDYDRHVRDHAAHREGLSTFVDYLFTARPATAPVPTNLALLREALRAESSLDFKAAERERMNLVENLVAKLSKDELQTLLDDSLSLKAGRVSYGDYQHRLVALCGRHGIDHSRRSSLAAYMAYVDRAERIDKDALLTELDREEATLPLTLARTPAEGRLAAAARRLSMLRRLTANEMSQADWNAYAAERDGVLALAGELKALGAGDVPSLDAAFLKPFEDFCRAALARNDALVGNLLAKMAAQKSDAAVLVAGGFHTRGLTDLLNKKDVSYVVVAPKIAAIPEGHSSVAAFTRDPLPLEKLLAGELISINYPRLANPELLTTVSDGGSRQGAAETIAAAVVGTFAPESALTSSMISDLGATDVDGAFAARRLDVGGEKVIAALFEEGRPSSLKENVRFSSTVSLDGRTFTLEIAADSGLSLGFSLVADRLVKGFKSIDAWLAKHPLPAGLSIKDVSPTATAPRGSLLAGLRMILAEPDGTRFTTIAEYEKRVGSRKGAQLHQLTALGLLVRQDWKNPKTGKTLAVFRPAAWLSDARVNHPRAWRALMEGEFPALVKRTIPEGEISLTRELVFTAIFNGNYFDDQFTEQQSIIKKFTDESSKIKSEHWNFVFAAQQVWKLAEMIDELSPDARSAMARYIQRHSAHPEFQDNRVYRVMDMLGRHRSARTAYAEAHPFEPPPTVLRRLTEDAGELATILAEVTQYRLTQAEKKNGDLLNEILLLEGIEREWMKAQAFASATRLAFDEQAMIDRYRRNKGEMVSFLYGFALPNDARELEEMFATLIDKGEKHLAGYALGALLSGLQADFEKALLAARQAGKSNDDRAFGTVLKTYRDAFTELMPLIAQNDLVLRDPLTHEPTMTAAAFARELIRRHRLITTYHGRDPDKAGNFDTNILVRRKGRDIVPLDASDSVKLGMKDDEVVTLTGVAQGALDDLAGKAGMDREALPSVRDGRVTLTTGLLRRLGTPLLGTVDIVKNGSGKGSRNARVIGFTSDGLPITSDLAKGVYALSATIFDQDAGKDRSFVEIGIAQVTAQNKANRDAGLPDVGMTLFASDLTHADFLSELDRLGYEKDPAGNIYRYRLTDAKARYAPAITLVKIPNAYLYSAVTGDFLRAEDPTLIGKEGLWPDAHDAAFIEYIASGRAFEALRSGRGTVFIAGNIDNGGAEVDAAFLALQRLTGRPIINELCAKPKGEKGGAQVRLAAERSFGGVPVRSRLVEGFQDRKSTRLNSSHNPASRMPSSA
jgi:hypothetical protein